MKTHIFCKEDQVCDISFLSLEFFILLVSCYKYFVLLQIEEEVKCALDLVYSFCTKFGFTYQLKLLRVGYFLPNLCDFV